MAPLGSLAWIFLKLGTTALGGPAAHIAMMRQEFVERRHWISDADFADLLGAANLIPGPSSTELAIHLGFRFARWPGLLLAGTCFILPAAIVVTILAWLYQTYAALPHVAGIMRMVKPVVVAIILQALRGLAVATLRTWVTIAVASIAFVMAALDVPQLLILVLCGAAVIILRRGIRAAAVLIPMNVSSFPASITPWGLFGVFFKIGAIVFGSGYVLLAFLQADLVDDRHWLSSRQLLDAVAVGQVTPGPVFTTATFIGYLLGGLSGAAIATFAIFLPGFILVAASGPLIPRIRRSPAASAFLDGVTAASIALIAWVLIVLGRASLTDALTIGIAAASFLLLIRFRMNSGWLILGAALIGAFTST